MINEQTFSEVSEHINELLDQLEKHVDQNYTEDDYIPELLRQTILPLNNVHRIRPSEEVKEAVWVAHQNWTSYLKELDRTLIPESDENITIILESLLGVLVGLENEEA